MMLHKFKRKAAAIAVFSMALMTFNAHAGERLPKPMGFKQVLVLWGPARSILRILNHSPAYPGVRERYAAVIISTPILWG